jgi:hypothetical protein
MSHITHSGYGYSKKLCENVTTWFLNKFFPRHQINVEIVHRGLKNEGVYGYCDIMGDNYRPRDFMIELQTHMDKELYIKTLFHELVHLRQWVTGSLQFRYGKLCYSKEPVEKYDYWHQPHEIEARNDEEELYEEYMEKMYGVVNINNLICSTVPRHLL